MENVPKSAVILVLVHSPGIGEAIATSGEKENFALRWSLDFARRDPGDGSAIVAQVADLHPALIVVELDAPARWLAHVHSDPATRRIPIVAIAADETALQRANAAHPEAIYTPEQFVAGLPDILSQYANVFDQAGALNSQCQDTPSTLVQKGLHEFNTQEFYECHETLEEAWKLESGPARDLYRVILQVGIAYYQIQRHNYNGAHKMFLRTQQWFAPLPDRCQGIDVAQLRIDAAAARAELEALGPARISEFDPALLKPIIYQELQR
jgi:Domain of unknown function (DUF309)